MTRIEMIKHSIEGVEEWIIDHENELVMSRLTGEMPKFGYTSLQSRISHYKIILSNLRIKLKTAMGE